MKDAKEILSKFLNTSQILEAGQVHEFFSAWEQIAGANLAAHSRIKELEQGIVYIETDHPGWIQLLKIEERKILSALQKRFSGLEIKGIRFFLGAPAVHTVPAAERRSAIQDEQPASGRGEPVGAHNQEPENTAERTLHTRKQDLSEGKAAILESIQRLQKLAEDNPRD